MTFCDFFQGHNSTTNNSKAVHHRAIVTMAVQ